MRGLGRPGVLAAIAFLGLLSAPAVAASASVAGPQAAATAEPHDNVAEPHSPRLLRELAGPRGASSRGARAGAVPTGPPGAVRGVDVAAFQHPVTNADPQGAPIDWSRVAADGIRFAAVKATEGNYYVNPFYAGDLADAAAAGLPVLGYAFANPKSGNGTGPARLSTWSATPGQWPAGRRR